MKQSDPLKKVKAEKDVLQNYIDISSLPANKRPKAFSDLSAEDKSNIFKLHLALQFIKRPGLTSDQKDIILESMSAITPDVYDRTKDRKNVEETSIESLQARATSIFPQQEAVEIFAKLGGTPEDIEMIKEYQRITSFPSFPERKIAFRKVSSAQMSDLWKLQLAFYLVQDDKLNNSQKEFILRVIHFANPSVYKGLKTYNEKSNLNSKIQVANLDKEIKTLEDEASSLFSEETLSTIFKKLGFTGSYKSSNVNNSIVADGGDFEIPVSSPSCTCRSGDCSEATVCASGGCESTWFGCGFIYVQSCNGECRR